MGSMKIEKMLIYAAIAFLAISFPPRTAYSAEPAPKEDAETSASASVKPAAVSAMTTGDEILSGTVGKAAQLSPLLSESFQTDLATGSATASIPIVVPPGRKNMQPALSLSYSSNNPNSVCGVGWSLSIPSIQRSTKRGVPKYNSTDTFIFSSSGSTGELVLCDASTNEYKQRIETAFMKYVFNSSSRWTVWDKSGMKYFFGSSADSRIQNGDVSKGFAFFLDRVEDVYGNAVIYTYEKSDGTVYLSRVDYTANDKVAPPMAADKSVEFVYEDGRPDRIAGYRSGWDIPTTKRLKEMRVKVDGALVWRYELTYAQSVDTGRSLLSEITLFDAEGNSLPPKRFTYQTIE